MMHISQPGLVLIKEFEGYDRVPYDDGNGYATAGYGHLIATKTWHDLPRSVIRKYTFAKGPEGERQASELLKSDIARDYEPYVYRAAKLNQHQFDATVSFVYNCGVGMLGTEHTFGKALHEGRYHDAADSLLLYDKDARGVAEPGLARRRREERDLFVKPLPVPVRKPGVKHPKPPPFNRTLRRGDHGSNVRLVQQQLNRKGLPRLNADGRFGARTQADVRLLQRRHRLHVDGVVGSHTWAALWG